MKAEKFNKLLRIMLENDESSVDEIIENVSQMRESYLQSRVNAISDEYRKDINKNHAMTDEVKHQRTQASLYIQNKLLKKG